MFNIYRCLYVYGDVHCNVCEHGDVNTSNTDKQIC
jgi:hypothetical protein